jgi:hypothetical protein
MWESRDNSERAQTLETFLKGFRNVLKSIEGLPSKNKWDKNT